MGKETGYWAVVYSGGIYTGTWQTRREAIAQHCRDVGLPWLGCRRRRGDRAVRVTITWSPLPSARRPRYS